MSTLTMVSLAETAKSGGITIKPFFDPNKENMGLEKYGLAMFDGVFHEEQLACLEKNGQKIWITGLNEFSSSVKNISNPEDREAKIKDIRKTVAQLERELASNVVEPEDPEFWNKIKLLRPDNHEFWEKISIRCGNQPVILDPNKEPYDLIKIYAIEAGGFSIIAKSYDDARSRAVPPKFFLDRYVETVSTKTELTKLKNKALAELIKLFDKNQNKLFLVAKVVDGNSVQYKKSTPNDVVYDNMDRFITGQGVEKSIKRASQNFLDACALSMEELKIKALIKDATYYKFIQLKADGFIYHTDTSTLMGRNVSDCLEFLKNPLQDPILLDLTKKVEKYWNI